MFNRVLLVYKKEARDGCYAVYDFSDFDQGGMGTKYDINWVFTKKSEVE